MTIMNFNALVLNGQGKNSVSLFTCGRLNADMSSLA